MFTKIKNFINNKFDNINNRYLYMIGAAICILTLFGRYVPLVSNDTSFMALKGKEFINNGFVYTDSLTMHDGLKLYPQKWLMNLIVYGFYYAGGLNGLRVGSFIVCVVKTLMIYITVNCINPERVLANTLLSVAIIYADSMFNDLRPGVLSGCLVLLLIIMLEKYVKTGKKRYLISVPVISFLTMSIHSTMWPVFIICMMPYLFESSFINKVLNKTGIESIIYTKYKKWPLVLALAAGLLAGLMNPNGMLQIGYTVKAYMSAGNSRFISELGHLTTKSKSLRIWICLVIFLLFSKIYKKTDMRFLFFFLGGFTLMFSSLRNFDYTIIFTAVAFANMLKHGDSLSGKPLFMARIMFITVFTIVSCSSIINAFNITDDGYYKKINDVQGINMAEYCDKNINKDAKMLNIFGIGATLELYGFRPYIDERSEVFDISINEKSDILLEYSDFSYNLIEKFDALNEKYGFEYIVWYSDTPFLSFMEKYYGAKKMYSDDEYCVLKLGDK